MRITVAKSEKDFDATAAARIVDAICAKPRCVIGLSTGRTTGGIHRQVCEMHERTDFDVSEVTLAGVDEVTGVDRDYFGACHAMLLSEIAGPLGIRDENFLMLPTRSDDFDAECRNFRAELRRRGGIDLLMLGLGENGHLGFNQPGSALNGTACTNSMDARLDARIRHETGAKPEDKLGGVTLGLADMMHARRIVLVAKGSNKREIVRRMLTDPVSAEVPATVLQLHPDCEFLLDAEAAEGLDINELRLK